MTVEQLIKKLQKFKPETEVYFENRINPVGNINDLYFVQKSTYGFFGQSIPCVILRGAK